MSENKYKDARPDVANDPSTPSSSNASSEGNGKSPGSYFKRFITTHVLKKHLVSNDRLEVKVHDETYLNDLTGDDAPPYFFDDLLQHLRAEGEKQTQYGLLIGKRYFEENDEGEPERYLEITGVRNLVNVESGIDFVHEIRRDPRILEKTDAGDVLGVVAIHPHQKEIMFEDVMLLRAYFTFDNQIFLNIDADSGKNACFALERVKYNNCLDQRHLVHLPFYVVSLIG